ncbi:hypothetical protein GHT06_008826 [Daphnia sinensis]|uniref:Uncharacterized protein n=1 Tax=Daphnia sinensis TaxID=1820382 RepID=A0AAD5LLT7_9CRUS|nr:hypothetical protein GHT06_008826 [Daphnia sinensis]
MSGFSGREQQERDLVERSRLRERGYYESRFQERERSPLRSAPRDFYRDQALYPSAPGHVHYEGYGRVGPDYVFDQRDFHSQGPSRNPRNRGRPIYDQRRVDPLAEQGGRSQYGEGVPRIEKSETPNILEQGTEDSYGDEEQPESEEGLEDLILDDLDDQDRLQKFYNRPWRPSSNHDKAEPAPLVVPQEVSDALSGWMAKGVSTEESKAISKKTPLEFLDKEFLVKPPKLDGYMHRRAKEKGKLRAVNASEESLITTQLKIMDVGPPLIDLYTRILSLGEERTEEKAQELVQDALRQRKTVIALAEPSFDFLTAEPEAFAPGKEARELLFTGKFLESMLKKASQDATLSRTARPRTNLGSKGKALADPSHSLPRHPFVLRPRKVTEQPHRGGGERGRPAGARAWTRGVQRYVRISKPVISPTQPSEEEVGARLLAVAGQWSEVTDDSWVLDGIAQGIKLDFEALPTQGGGGLNQETGDH